MLRVGLSVWHCSLPIKYNNFVSPKLLNATHSHIADRQPVWQSYVLHLQVTLQKTGLAGCKSFTDRMRNSLSNKEFARVDVKILWLRAP